MGRLFAKASSQYAELTASVPSAEPMTLSCWYNATDFATAPICLAVHSGTTSGLKLGFTTGGAVQIVATDSGGSNGVANSSTNTTAGTWAHALGTTSANNSRSAYLNAFGLQTNTTPITLSGLSKYVLGANYNGGSRNFYANGVIADAAVWNVALSSQEILALSQGISPLLIRPASLVFYAPLWGEMSPELNLRGAGVTLGAAGAAPTLSPLHPRIYQGGRSVGVVI